MSKMVSDALGISYHWHVAFELWGSKLLRSKADIFYDQ